MPRFSRALPTAVAFLALLFASAWTAHGAEQDFSETFAFAADGRLSLENINGDVTLEAWDRNEVKVQWIKRGRSEQDLERMQVEIDVADRRIHIETRYVKTEGWGHGGGEVEYHVWLPRGARVDEVELVNGGLRIRGVGGLVSASLVNGDVEASDLGGDVELETVNGRLQVSLTRLDAGQSIELSSVNGRVEVLVPKGASADFEVETVHGRIRNDFGLPVEKDEHVGRSLRGAVGGGGARVEIDTVNGSVEIREL